MFPFPIVQFKPQLTQNPRLRFYDIQSGDILINNTSIYTLEIEAYRKHISLVSQEPTLFQGTIRDNLLLGVDASSVTDEDMYGACRAAEIHDFVMSLPEGYSTDPGLRATALSVGQTQRLTLARALLRSPHLLLLDEATSSLDSASEKLVQAALERAAKGRTMLVVAHRLATVQRADVIFVMGEGGQVVEKGRHGELVRKGGVYAGMVSRVFLSWRLEMVVGKILGQRRTMLIARSVGVKRLIVEDW